MLASIAFIALPNLSSAQSSDSGTMAGSQGSSASETKQAKQARTATQHVDKATDVVRRMETDPGMAKLLSQAKGVFIVPKYGRGAFVIGVNGGPGVLLVKHEGTWSEPAFYTIGGLSAGAQAGLEVGSIALVLNNDKAVNNFMQNNKFALNANAGLTIVNWSKQAERDAGRGDVVVWADAKGVFGGVAVAINDIRFDRRETAGYYQREVSAKDVIDGKVTNPHSAALKQALAGASSSSTSSGGSSTEETSGGGSTGSQK
jgi:lipid-binding SYLF domain-containing protein